MILITAVITTLLPPRTCQRHETATIVPMSDSIFTKIIKGEIPCHKVHEDEHTLAFMDIHPIQPGHVLVVSKREVDHVWDLPDEEYRALMTTVKNAAQRIRDNFPGKRAGLIIEGFEVPHAHAKVFPIASGDELRSKPDMTVEPDPQTLAELAQKLAF